MRKVTSAVMTGAVVLSLAGYALNAGACPRAKSTSTSAAGCSKTAQHASLGARSACGAVQSAGSACAVRSVLPGLFKEAPGTRTELVSVNNGVSLVVSAAGTGNVTTVQQAMARELDRMKSTQPGAATACPHGSTSKTAAGACLGAAGSSADKAAHPCAGVKSGSGAGLNKAGQSTGATVTAATECPEWMSVLCCARADLSNTATGVTLTWTTDKPELVEKLRSAGQEFQAEIARL